MVSPEYAHVIENPKVVYDKKCIAMVEKILSDCTHPMLNNNIN